MSKKGLNEHILVLQNDTNTGGYSQWFFFRISNTRANTTYHFNIINFQKPNSLYKKGMKVCVYSQKKEEETKIGWHREGKNIQYYKNGIYKMYNERKKNYSSMSFSYDSAYDNDTVYFANSIPYFYSDLMKELNEFERDDVKYK